VSPAPATPESQVILNLDELYAFHIGGAPVEPEIINLHNKRVEQSVISISIKIAHAIEMVQKTKEMTANSERMLVKAYLELEELYTKLGDENQ
jgi:hypothetical protein